MLAWSFNRDGEAKQGLVERRDQAMGINMGEIRERRQELVGVAKPQEGVDALKGALSGPTKPIHGVVAKGAGELTRTLSKDATRRIGDLSPSLLTFADCSFDQSGERSVAQQLDTTDARIDW